MSSAIAPPRTDLAQIEAELAGDGQRLQANASFNKRDRCHRTLPCLLGAFLVTSPVMPMMAGSIPVLRSPARDRLHPFGCPLTGHDNCRSTVIDADAFPGHATVVLEAASVRPASLSSFPRVGIRPCPP